MMSLVRFQRDNRMDLGTVNHLDRRAFAGALGAVFEHSPWVAERAFGARPFANVDSLHEAMVQAVKESGPDAQLELLRAHPELAGKEARAGTMTASSNAEQSGVGLTALSRPEMARIAQMNRHYRDKFGFPFIIAVKQHTKSGIFAEFERRLNNDAETELANALAQVFIITRLRLDAMFAQH